MSDPRVRREIALRAAQLMYSREVAEYYTAKRKAAKMVAGAGAERLRDLPSNREIREQILAIAELAEGEQRFKNLRRMRLDALRMMRLLAAWRPHLIGSVLTGHIRAGSDIDLHIFCDSPVLIIERLEAEGLACELEHKRVRKHNEERVFTHIHVTPTRTGPGTASSIELTVYAADKVNYPFKSSITGTRIERADIAHLEALLRADDSGTDPDAAPDTDLDAELAALDNDSEESWALFEDLLLALEQVRQNPKHHPEGDAMYHSLQVFDLARRARDFDQEFLLAALLHDVGKGLDPRDHVAAGLAALQGHITPRTAWLIEHHMTAHDIASGAIGVKARRRLAAHPDFEELMLLEACDSEGRRGGLTIGIDLPTVQQALEFLRDMEE
jgi:hypothetical protein